MWIAKTQINQFFNKNLAPYLQLNAWLAKQKWRISNTKEIRNFKVFDSKISVLISKFARIIVYLSWGFSVTIKMFQIS